MIPVFSDTAIAITDNEHHSFTSKSHDWPRSNPKGYEKWFKGRMAKSYEQIRKSLAEGQRLKGVQVNVEDIPDYKVRTPLQQVVMILKRHRDDVFKNTPKEKPISIIITTLAGHAYEGESDTPSALLGILNRMDNYILDDGHRCIITNPTDATENFADRWEKYPERQKAFFQWLKKARADFFELSALSNLQKMHDAAEVHIPLDLRQRVISRAMKASGVSMLGVATPAPTKAEREYSFQNEPRTPRAPRDFCMTFWWLNNISRAKLERQLLADLSEKMKSKTG